MTQGWSPEAYRLLAERVIRASAAADPPQMFRRGWRTISAERVVPDTQVDPYFAFHLLPFGYRHELLTLCTARKPKVLLTFSRKAKRGAFEARDIRLLDAWRRTSGPESMRPVYANPHWRIALRCYAGPSVIDHPYEANSRGEAIGGEDGLHSISPRGERGN